jgi:hypothetical protein
MDNGPTMFLFRRWAQERMGVEVLDKLYLTVSATALAGTCHVLE